jgi:cell division protein FtsW (lipid II flippase)
MWDYLKLHEAYIKEALANNPSPKLAAKLLAFHETQIARMQHERLIHLMVTLACCLFLLLVMGFTLVHPFLPGELMSLLLLVLVSAYLVHYFRLENGVQRWYHLANRLHEKAGG